MTNFNRMRSRMHSNYNLSFDARGSKTLIVVFSPNVKFALRKHPFKYDCLYISDNKLFYYLYNPGRQAMVLQDFIEKRGYERAIFLGSSKGGAGALLWSSLIFSRKPNFSIYCMAFSPQTKLYPHNENLVSLPSYVGSMKVVAASEAHRANAETYGDIPAYIRDKTPPTRVAYSANYRMDAVEAKYLTDNEAVELVPIDIGFHGSITPFVTDVSDPDQMKRLATKLYADAEKDKDLRAALPIWKSSFYAMFSNLRCPPLNEYIDEFCGQA